MGIKYMYDKLLEEKKLRKYRFNRRSFRFFSPPEKRGWKMFAIKKWINFKFEFHQLIFVRRNSSCPHYITPLLFSFTKLMTIIFIFNDVTKNYFCLQYVYLYRLLPEYRLFIDQKNILQQVVLIQNCFLAIFLMWKKYISKVFPQ